jgi:ubiquitin C-terminal hydrolase
VRNPTHSSDYIEVRDRSQIEEKKKIWKANQKKFEDSRMNDLQGVKVEEKMCASCKHIRFTYSTFSSISV